VTLCDQFFIHVNGINFLVKYCEKVKSEFIPLQKWIYLNKKYQANIDKVVSIYEWEIRFDNLYVFFFQLWDCVKDKYNHSSP